MDRTFDVAVVGGSIAGSTAATLFARQGLKVALIEARSNPDAYKALCTHFIQPSATPTIQRLGLDGPIEAAGGLRNSLEVWNRWGWIKQPEGGDYGYSIRRQKLDPLVRQTAAQTPGVELMAGHTATGLIRNGSRVCGVEVRDQNGEVTRVLAALVVAADGRHSKIGELAGVGVRSIPNKRSGYFAYFEGVEQPGSTTRTWFLDPDVAYAFPNDDGVTVLAVMFDRSKLEWFKKDFAGNLKRTFERLPDGPDLSNAVQVSKVLGAVDLPNTWRRKPLPGLAFAGDAMIAGDPLFGIGCGWAFQTGEWLAETAGPHIHNEAELDEAVDSYRTLVRKRVLPHFLMTSEYSLSRHYNPAERLLFSAGAHDAKVAGTLHAFAARTIPVSQLVSPRNMGRAMMVNLRTRTPKPVVKQNQAIATAVVQEPPPPGVRSETIQVAGLSSPMIEAGPAGSTEAVVFVHGNPGSSKDFFELVGKVGEFCRAVAIDMPGFGKADKPADFDYTVEGYAAHLGQALRQLGIERAHLVLHDFGGPWGLAWAAANPGAFASVALIDTGVLLDYDWHYLAKIWQTPVLGELFMASATGPAFRLLLRHGNHGGLPRSFLDQMYEDFDKGTKRAVIELYRATKSTEGPFQVLKSALGHLDRPALVIWGGNDPYVGVIQAEAQKATFPQAQVVVLENSGHWPFIDDPQGVEEALLPFLKGAVSSQRQLTSA